MKTKINGKEIFINDTDKDLSLLEYLREKLNLTGTKKGCEIGACGTCTILINGKAVQSCTKKVSDIESREVLTIEGLEKPDGTLHPIQQAFIDAGAIQCGYCTPAMVLRGYALLLSDKNPDREKIRNAINPVLCRCTGYQQIIDAIEDAAKHYSQNEILTFGDK